MIKIKELNMWFANTDFATLEKMTGLKYYLFNDEDGYQEFVDVCEKWWKKLTVSEKESIYHEYGEV